MNDMPILRLVAKAWCESVDRLWYVAAREMIETDYHDVDIGVTLYNITRGNRVGDYCNGLSLPSGFCLDVYIGILDDTVTTAVGGVHDTTEIHWNILLLLPTDDVILSPLAICKVTEDGVIHDVDKTEASERIYRSIWALTEVYPELNGLFEMAEWGQ